MISIASPFDRRAPVFPFSQFLTIGTGIDNVPEWHVFGPLLAAPARDLERTIGAPKPAPVISSAGFAATRCRSSASASFRR